MSTTANPTPDWYPDPTGRFEQRYWDGLQWTEHVSSAGQQRVDPLPGAPTSTAQTDLPGLGDVTAAAAPVAEAPVPEPPVVPTPTAQTPVVQEPATQAPVPSGPAADWYPDPTGRYEQRYWDGLQWTEHASAGGQAGIDPLQPGEGGPTSDGAEQTPAASTASPADEPASAPSDAATAVEPNPFAAAAVSAPGGPTDGREGVAPSPTEPPAADTPTAVEPEPEGPTGDDGTADDDSDGDDDGDEDGPADDGGPPSGGGPGPTPDPTPAPAASGPEADWYPDPTGRHELRYWDGYQWTDHASSGGRQVVDPVGQITEAKIPVGDHDASKVQKQVQQQAGAVSAGPGGGSLFTEPILVVNQKWKLIEVNNEYAVYDQNGNQIGAVRQVGQTAAKKAVRVLTNLDQFMTHSLQVVDMTGTVQLTMTRPAKFVKSKVEVGDGAGQAIGTVIQQNAIGKIRFSLDAGGHTYGSINAENWRAWNFNIQDHAGAEVARITKTWEGLAKTMFTTADNYVLQIHRPLEEPLRSLVVASALCVDTALKQDSRGLG